ncbi:MAG: phosphatidylserine/phosphatidylglycerophosphate/cardiolipin synthase family protein [Vicinamibacterales bacterium]
MTRAARRSRRPSAWRAARRRRRGWSIADPRGRPAKGAFDIGLRARRLLWSWWPWAALAVWLALGPRSWWAVAAAVMAFISHLIAPREEPPRYGLDHEFTADSDEFVATMAGATGVPLLPGNTFEILDNGDAFYPRMLHDIAAARTTITIEAYIYWAGDVGMTFAQALAERARAGVRVMILLDAVGSTDIGRETLATLEQGGCQVAWYNPITWRTLGRFNNRTHRKSLIVDGVVGYTGGAGFADHWRGQARNPEEWRDVQVRVEGPAVMPLQSGFAHNWQQATGELVSGEGYYPVLSARGPHTLQVILSSPENGASSVRIMYYLAIVCARRSILIANPYFVPDPVAIQTLVEAKRRGVKVRIMVAGVHNDNWLARQNSVRLYGPLLEAGIEILEYNRTMLHHKVMVVDGVWATVGTTNFDNRSFAHNEESNVSVFAPEVARQFEASFEDDVAGCDRVALDAWRRRGLVARAGEHLASLLENQV